MLRRSGRLSVSSTTPWSSSSYSTASLIGTPATIALRYRSVFGKAELRSPVFQERRHAFGCVVLTAEPTERLPLAVERRLAVGLAQKFVRELLGDPHGCGRGVLRDLVG